NDLRVRQALNFAVDRAAIVRAYGGSLADTPSCQTIPPGEPGYRRYCPYTRDPAPARPWVRPDLPTPPPPVAQSKTRGASVSIWDVSDTGTADVVIPLLVHVLLQLGYHPHVRVLSTKEIGRTTAAQRAAVDLVPVISGPDYPSAAENYSLFLA